MPDEIQESTIKAQNYYRFGRLDEVVIEDVRLKDVYPALFIFEASKKITFKNCYFPAGIILCGFYDELIFIDSNIKVINSDVNARKIYIENTEDNSANLISFIDCKLKFLTDLKAIKSQVKIRTINEVFIMNELSLEDSDLIIASFTLNCDKLTIKGHVNFDLDSSELCYSYYPLSTLQPRIRCGLKYAELKVLEGAKTTFSTNWNELFFLNGELKDPKNTTLPEDMTGLEDFYQRKDPGDAPGEAFCY